MAEGGDVQGLMVPAKKKPFDRVAYQREYMRKRRRKGKC